MSAGFLPEADLEVWHSRGTGVSPEKAKTLSPGTVLLLKKPGSQ